METRDYAAIFEMLIDGSMLKSKMTEDDAVLLEPSRFMQMIRAELPIGEQAKLSEAIIDVSTRPHLDVKPSMALYLARVPA